MSGGVEGLRGEIPVGPSDQVAELVPGHKRVDQRIDAMEAVLLDGRANQVFPDLLARDYDRGRGGVEGRLSGHEHNRRGEPRQQRCQHPHPTSPKGASRIPQEIWDAATVDVELV